MSLSLLPGLPCSAPALAVESGSPPDDVCSAQLLALGPHLPDRDRGRDRERSSNMEQFVSYSCKSTRGLGAEQTRQSNKFTDSSRAWVRRHRCYAIMSSFVFGCIPESKFQCVFVFVCVYVRQTWACFMFDRTNFKSNSQPNLALSVYKFNTQTFDVSEGQSYWSHLIVLIIVYTLCV